MAYINFTLLFEKEFTTKDFIILQIIKQSPFEDLTDHLVSACDSEVENLLEFEDKGLVEFIKGKKGDTFFQRARLSKKGSELLDSLEIAEVLPEDEIIWDWLVKVYKNKDKKIGNTKKGKRYLAQFRIHSGLSRNKLSYLCHAFIIDETRMEYSHILEYVFFKPANVFTTRFDLEESKLWAYYQEHFEAFQEEFKNEKYGN